METQALARGAGLLGAWGGGFLGTWRSLPLPGADVGFISVEALRKTCEAGCLPPSLQGWSPRCEAASWGVWGPPPLPRGCSSYGSAWCWAGWGEGAPSLVPWEAGGFRGSRLRGAGLAGGSGCGEEGASSHPRNSHRL